MTKTLYVPDHIMEKYNNPSEGVQADRTELQKLPKPVGWRILVLPFKAKQQTKGGVIPVSYTHLTLPTILLV